MASYELSVKADQMVNDIIKYTLINYGERQTDVYIGAFEKALHVLAEQPGLGRKFCGHLRYNYASHVVIYEKTDYGIYVIDIFHEREDIENKIK